VATDAGNQPQDSRIGAMAIGAPPTSWGGIVTRAAKNFLAHQMTDRAATLTYFAMMSLFPGLLLIVTLLGLFGQQGLVNDATDYLLRHGVAEDTVNQVRRVLQGMISSSGGALSVALVVSLLLALNGASGAFGAAGRSLNVVYGVEEDRGMVRRKLTDALSAIVVIALFAIALASIFLGGQIASDLFGKIGLGDTAATIWSIVRWPIALLAAMIGYALVYGLAPDRQPRRVHWISPGAVLGVLLWIVLSAGFAIFLRNFSSYGAAYGAFSTAIILLLWLYLSANAFLFGAELNAEIERTGHGRSRSVSSGG
jgi:membrane protein